MIRPSELRGALAPLACALLLLTPAAAQDVIGDGFAATSTQVVPAAFSSHATLSTGDLVVFDGFTVDLYDANGVFAVNLATLPGFVFNSFVCVDPGETYAICGESLNGDLFRVALDGTGYTTLCTLPLNYDAAFEDAGHLLVSAVTCTGNCGNDVVRVDVGTGAWSVVANVPGASGPLDVAPNGDVYYATIDNAFPATPGYTSVLRWSAAQVSGGAQLSELDASVVAAGFDGAASLCVEPKFGYVFLAESIFGGTSRVLELDPQGGGVIDVVVESSNWLNQLEIGDRGGNGHFHAYQPDTGTYLRYDNGNLAVVDAARPTGSVVYNGNAVSFHVSGAKPNGAVLVTWGSSGTWNPNETSYTLGFDFQYHTGIPLGQVRRLNWYLPVDANGDATFSYFDLQHLAGTLVFQALVTDEQGGFIGSSSAALN
ncbi:MAG: hypothetical protein H6828_15460 [Planctomycetes bacterium]|nr:hypothetical protein [Planctomycetota bacterium]